MGNDTFPEIESKINNNIEHSDDDKINIEVYNDNNILNTSSHYSNREKKNMFKNFNKNLEKMLSILEKNKDKFDNLELKTNPMFYLRKMKNTKDQNEREEYLTQLRALIESDDESENDDN